MAKFTTTQTKKSLLNDISLMEKDIERVWVEFDEIPIYIKKGFTLFNIEKQKLYEKIKK